MNVQFFRCLPYDVWHGFQLGRSITLRGDWMSRARAHKEDGAGAEVIAQCVKFAKDYHRDALHEMTRLREIALDKDFDARIRASIENSARSLIGELI